MSVVKYKESLTLVTAIRALISDSLPPSPLPPMEVKSASA